jgi:hypothetical protein
MKTTSELAAPKPKVRESDVAQGVVSPLSAVKAIARAVQHNRDFLDTTAGAPLVEDALATLSDASRYWAAASMTSHTAGLLDLKANNDYARYPDDVRRQMEITLQECIDDSKDSDAVTLPELTPTTLFIATAAIALEAYEPEQTSELPPNPDVLEAQDLLDTYLPNAWEDIGGTPDMVAKINARVATGQGLLQ